MIARRRKFRLCDLGMLALLALAVFLIHLFTNHRYGFHRDELAMIEDARHLAWSYVSYPPLAPFFARVSLELFGTSPVGMRMIPALVQSLSLILTGLMARELGGGRFAQVVTAVAAVIAPQVLFMGQRIDYLVFDYLWWLLAAYGVIRLLKLDNPRWWLLVGVALGFGMNTKYTIAVFALAIVGGTLLTRARRTLASPWLWAGVALSAVLLIPNLIWQAQHDFIAVDFTRSIHERDIAWDRTDDFLLEQVLISSSPITAPLWIAGLAYFLLHPEGRRWRMLGWMYLISLALFLLMQGRSYYLSPAYPMLFAGGAVWLERRLFRLSAPRARLAKGAAWAALAVAALVSGMLALPVAPINSGVWDMTAEIHDGFREEIGWQDLVAAVDAVYDGMPAGDRARTAILAGNYGEAGAIALYGPDCGLPPAISAINSFWLRGYGDVPPERVIAVGFPHDGLEARYFTDCAVVGKITNRYGVENEETTMPDILLCRGARRPWDDMWADMQHFG